MTTDPDLGSARGQGLAAGPQRRVLLTLVLGQVLGGLGTGATLSLGALLIGVINNGLVLAGLDTSQQNIVRGAIIILAVALARRK